MNSIYSQPWATIPVNEGYVVVGTCSICRGPVTQYMGAWYGINPPTKSCSKCGATEAPNYGPVIPMVPTRTSEEVILDRTITSGLVTSKATWPPPQNDDPQYDLWPK